MTEPEETGERAEALAAVRRRLETAHASRSYTAVTGPAAVQDARRLEAALGDNGREVEAWYLLGSLYWLRHEAAPAGPGSADVDGAARAFLYCFTAGVGSLPPPLLPSLAREAAPIGSQILKQAHATQNPAACDAAVGLWRRILDATPVADPEGFGYLSCLGAALYIRFCATDSADDLDEAIDVFRLAVAESPGDHPLRPGFLNNLGTFLLDRFRRTGSDDDLNAAVAALRSPELTRSATPVDLTALYEALLSRSHHTDNVVHLDPLIELVRELADTTAPGDPVRAAHLHNLAAACGRRYALTRSAADLAATADAWCRALAATEPDTPEWEERLAALTETVTEEMARTGRVPQVLAVLTALREAGPAPDQAGRRNNSAYVLEACYAQCGALEILEAAVAHRRTSAEAARAGHPLRGLYLALLAEALRLRYGRSDAVADLAEAERAAHRALEATPPDAQYRHLVRTTAAVLAYAKSERTGKPHDVDDAVEALRTALTADTAGEPTDRTWLLWSLLGAALRLRYTNHGHLADLEGAVHAGRRAAEELPAGDPNRANALALLASAQQLRAVRTGRPADLDAAVAAARTAAQATAPGHTTAESRSPLALQALGEALRLRFQHTGGPSDRDEAAAVLTDLANTDAAPPAPRIEAARNAAGLLADTAPERAADLMESAVHRMPDAASHEILPADRQRALTGLTGLASEAAAVALADPRGDKDQRAQRALRLLEAGRAVLLGQALEARSDLTELRAAYPGLAERFATQRDRLNHAPTNALAVEPDEQRRAARAYHATLAEIRCLPGFSAFGLPPTADDLLKAAAHGPVVSFSTGLQRSDALLLTESGVRALPLPDLDHATLTRAVQTFHGALEDAALATQPVRRRQAQAALGDILEWLWDACAGPVLTALGHHGPAAPGAPWPRVWWVPGGLLGQLPLHAAGHHTHESKAAGRRTVMDRVVSSYTPTVRALQRARQQHDAAPARMHAMVVAVPHAPGARPLPHALDEAQSVRTRLPDALVLGADGAGSATKRNVMERLPGSAIVHFACHATNHPDDPTRSRLLLLDHPDDPFTVGDMAAMDLPGARLAYLSACRTAEQSAAELADEAIHLASAFQLAGYPHVIGTLWPVDDRVAAQLADSFYCNLLSPDGTADTGRSAQAIHAAVRDLRDRFPRTPFLWAAHLHTGA
ncbi:CHAT domain-containing protein [Streptomyces sp. NPDC001401]|uniref:CHAT domain-containing protein n=1 Tax=Streptomyces sp. NPDC001401 TaxID=3364570 RepID=UPI0036AB4C5E